MDIAVMLLAPSDNGSGNASALLDHQQSAWPIDVPKWVLVAGAAVRATAHQRHRDAEDGYKGAHRPLDRDGVPDVRYAPGEAAGAAWVHLLHGQMGFCKTGYMRSERSGECMWS